MGKPQTGILEDNVSQGRFMIFGVQSADAVKECLQNLNEHYDSSNTLIGIGQSVVNCLGKKVEGLKTFPVLTGSALDIPSTPAALWCWCRGTDRGEIFHRSRGIESMLMPGFVLESVVDSFQFKKNRDMSGYEDGTENPQGENAINAAIVKGMTKGLDGSSFVAVQQWVHDFDAFSEMTTDNQDNAIGRRISDNEEIDDAPESAHVKRTAQETFEPEAFVVRRSMPWMDDMSAGLNFIAFGSSFDAFEAQLRRMVGLDDGVVDALFSFTRPVSGNYFWCPPVEGGKLDLSLLGV